MEHQEIGKRLCGWALDVYNAINSGFYPEMPFELQMTIFLNQMNTAKTNEEFWQAFNNVLGYTICTLIDDEPASSEESKKARMNTSVLVPIIKEASVERPELSKIIPTLQKGFPKPQEFYSALSKTV